MMIVRSLIVGIVTVALALFAAALATRAAQNAPPDNLSVSGTILSWRDNSAEESGFEVSIMPVGGQAAPVFTHDLPANSTSFDLASDPRACTGPIAVGVAALFRDGTQLNAASLVDANIMGLCATTSTPTAAVGTPVASATAPWPTLPSTGTGTESGSPRRALALAVLSVVAVALAVAVAVGGRRVTRRA